MKKSPVALLTVLASAVLLTACASDDDWRGHHDQDRDRDHRDDHSSQLQAEPRAAFVPPESNL